MSYYRVEVLADSITSIVPRSGGQFGHQVEVVLDMSNTQRRCAIATMLAAMPEGEAYDWLRSEFPAWFKEAA
jgi:hypothetical protein